MEKLKMYFLLFSAMLFYQSSLYQRMVNCCFGSRWFGFLGSRDEKKLSLRGAPIRIPNPKPPIPKPPIIHYSNVECGVFSLIIPPLVSPSDSGGISHRMKNRPWSWTSAWCGSVLHRSGSGPPCWGDPGWTTAINQCRSVIEENIVILAMASTWQPCLFAKSKSCKSQTKWWNFVL